MPTNPPNNTPSPIFPSQATSNWGSLNRGKLAVFTLCDEKGNALVDSSGSPIDVGTVEAVLLDGDFVVESQYSSPFESSNPESKLPTLMGMLQSGTAASFVSNVSSSQPSGVARSAISLAAKATIGAANLAAYAVGFDSFGAALESLKGRTNFTKVNSTMIFVSTSSIRMPLTLYFQALRDASIEVEDQIRQLEQWSVPISLSDVSVLQSIATDQAGSGLFPSYVPPYISMTYAGKTYVPFIIEHVASPIVTPMDQDLNRLNVSVTITIASRQAWDQRDVAALYGKNKNA